MTNQEEQQHGFLLIDKPANITSHDVVDVLRRVTGIKKIGHTGTLDPFATGLLLIGIGRNATKHMQELVGQDKIYEATIVLGATTETLDTEAPIEKSTTTPNLSRLQVQAAAQQFIGDIKQIPPMYSAIKVNGQALYKLARKGETVKRKPRNVHISSFEILGFKKVGDVYHVKTRIHCSSGTYIRSLARDFAKNLNTVGYLFQLRRTDIGPNNIQDAIKLGEITAKNWRKKLKNFERILVDENRST